MLNAMNNYKIDKDDQMIYYFCHVFAVQVCVTIKDMGDCLFPKS